MWLCPKCGEELGDYNEYCEYCFVDSDRMVTIYNPDICFVRDIRQYHLSQGDKAMTPGEELFANFFKKHTDIVLVKNMSILEMRKYREDYSIVAAEAKAAIYAVSQLIDKAEKTSKGRNGQGFKEDTKNTDVKTDAINIIKKRLSKKEQIQKQIEELYRDFGNPDAAKDAAKAVSATNISEVVKVKNTINPFAKPKKTAEQEAIEAFLGPAKLIMKPEQAKPTVDSKLDSDKPKIAKSINPFATGKR